MKILFLITSLGVGGAENIVASLADNLVKKGFNVKIICLRGQILVKPKSEDIEIVNLKFNSLVNFFSAIRTLKKVINEFKPDVIHAHMFHSIILARLLRIFLKIPKLISTAHSKSYGGSFRGFLYKITDSLSDINTNVSNEATDFFIEKQIFKYHNTITVSNGVDIIKFKPNSNIREKLRCEFKIDKKEKVFIAVGRFNEAKDYPTLLKAFSLFSKQSLSDSRLIIVGDGVLRGKIENMISDYKLENNVLLMGIRNDVPDLLNMADIFVLSSAWEGFGLVVAEAMATEKIVISTDCGGVKEVIGHSDFIVPIRDPIALAEKMLNAEKMDENSKNIIGQCNRQRVIDHYSSNAMVEHWIKIFNR